MGLACECGGDYEWYYYTPKDFSILKSRRSCRCVSCSELMSPGTEVLKFERYRDVRTDIEERIHGDEVELAPQYMCEECGGLFLSLSELGFCISIGEQPMKELVAEYNREYAGRPNGQS